MDKNKKLKIAVLADTLPYTSCKPNYTGIAIDIWEKTVIKYKLEYEFICVSRNYDKIVNDLSKGEYDVVLGDFSVIHRRFNLVLFSRPYYIATINIYRKSSGNYLYKLITNKSLHNIFFMCFLLIFLYSFLYKYYTRATFIDSFYETFLNFFSKTKEILPTRGNKFYSKILNVSWAIFRYIFYTFVLTKMISIFLKISDIISPEELKLIKNVNVVQGTSFVDYIKKIGKTPLENNTSDDIIKKMNKSSEHEYWSDDSNVIKSIINKSKYNMDIMTSENPIAYDEIAIIVNKNRRDILDKLNSVIIELQDNGYMNKICKQYLEGIYLIGCGL